MAQNTAKGRPLDGELTDRVLAAVRSELDENGFMNLRIERVASTLGCGKTAIYRRWPNKPELVAAALLDGLDLGTEPDTGDVVDDLVEHAWQNLENFRRSQGDGSAGNGLFLAMFDRDVIPLISKGFLQKRRIIGRAILARAVERGEVATDLDHDLVIDTLAGLTMFRMTVDPESRTESDAELKDTYRRLARALVGKRDQATGAQSPDD